MFLFSLKVLSQDTICYLSGSKIAVIIKEISPKEIKYVKFDKPNGIIFFEDKQLLKYIKYAGGLADTVRAYAKPDTKNYYEFDGLKEKMYPLKLRIIYKSVVLKDESLLILLNKYPVETTKKILLSDYKQMKRLNNNRYLFILTGIVAANVAFLGLNTYKSSHDNHSNAYLLPASCGLIVGTSIYFSRKLRKKEILKRREISELYNASSQ